MVIHQQFCITFNTNVQHWTEQVSWNYADMNDWPLTQRISAPDELMQINVLEESFHYAQCALLQHSCCRSHPVSHTSASTMLTGHTSLHPGVALNICIELSQRYSGFVSLNFRRASLIYSANSEHSALTFGPYTCIKHRERSNKFNLNMHSLLMGSIPQHSLSAVGLKVCPHQTGQTLLA